MRLFIAIPLPADVTEALFALQRRIAMDGARLTQVKAEHMHITLAFLGERNDAEAIGEKLRAMTITPFQLMLGSLGSFGGRTPRVIWAGISESAALARVHRQIGAALGIHETMRAHITLARVRACDETGCELLGRAIKEVETPRVMWTVDRACLYSSSLTPSGPIHAELASTHILFTPQ
ncbi:MAG: RNA 2',3'-cyclic phosphodiesterase [Nanoarchaeota archaeon]